MARKYFSFRSFHRGTVLFEALLVSVILSLAALAVIPLYTEWRSEKRLELAGGSGFGDTAGGNPCEK